MYYTVILRTGICFARRLSSSNQTKPIVRGILVRCTIHEKEQVQGKVNTHVVVIVAAFYFLLFEKLELKIDTNLWHACEKRSRT